jgi:parvulin-like peptidyl-prolyl isomerase
VKSAFGWHVIQFMHRYGDGGDAGWLEDLRTRATAGIDFGQLARDNGEGPEARDGGDIGWVIHGQLDEVKEAAIFDTKVGAESEIISIPGEGAYLYKVLAEETKAPDADQIKAFEDSGFANWYAAKKAEVDISRDITSGSSV